MRVAQGKGVPRTNPAFAFWLTDSFVPGGGGWRRQGRAACWSVALSALERLRRPYVVPVRIGGVLAGWLHGVNAGVGDGAGDVGLGGLTRTTRAKPVTTSHAAFTTASGAGWQ